MPENCTQGQRCSCETLEEYIGYMYIIPIICSLAVVFNVLVLLVFSRAEFHTRLGASTLAYLTGLAVADGVASLVSLPIGFVRCFESEVSSEEYFRSWYDKFVFHPLVNTFGTASVWLTLAVSLERCIFVTLNHVTQSQHHALFRKKTAHALLVVIYFSALALNLPAYFYYQGISMEDSTLTRSDFAESVGYDVYSWIRMFLGRIIPIVMVTVCNGVLIKTTRSKTRRISAVAVMTSRMAARRHQTQERLTCMLLSISTAFIVCNVAEPFAHSGIYKAMFGPGSISEDEYYIFVMFTSMFEFIAYTTNFISYCIYHKHFVATLKLVLLCKATKVAPSVAARQRRMGVVSMNPYVINSMSTEGGGTQEIHIPHCHHSNNQNSNNTQSSDEPGRSSQKALIFSKTTTVW